LKFWKIFGTLKISMIEIFKNVNLENLDFFNFLQKIQRFTFLNVSISQIFPGKYGIFYGKSFFLYFHTFHKISEIAQSSIFQRFSNFSEFSNNLSKIFHFFHFPISNFWFLENWIFVDKLNLIK